MPTGKTLTSCPDLIRAPTSFFAKPETWTPTSSPWAEGPRVKPAKRSLFRNQKGFKAAA